MRDLEAERRARDESQTSWGPDALRRILRQDLKGDEVLIVSNREPYIHTRRKDNVIEIQRPASGLVTALEPIVRACSGTWIAHGAGYADRETVDKHDHVMVPPEHPAYRIRRVWLSKEEEQGYYFGFANEGLWPLCHIAHTRPTFRAQDWEHYRNVNQRFADIVADEARTEDPIVLVQDYHFALLPRMVRERLPRATIITFWHIPWPNPEAFGILPWREEMLEGMLGSSILGFHTQFHCNNFFDTVDRFLEARVDRETFTISYGGNTTEVRRYPISIEWPPAALQVQPPVRRVPRGACASGSSSRTEVKLGVGVDRLDYTKGILERFMAIERLLELEPRWVGQFSFVQVAAPSRSSIDEYQNLDARVRALAARINERFGRPGYAADHPEDRAPRRGAGLRALPRSRAVLRLEPARRHEPGGEGVRRRARRRAGRADPVAVHRRGARAGRVADRQSLRHRAERGGDAPRAHHVAGRAARAHAQHAHPGAGIQRLPLGGTHAARRGAHAPPPPRAVARARRAAQGGRARARACRPCSPTGRFSSISTARCSTSRDIPTHVRIGRAELDLVDGAVPRDRRRARAGERPPARGNRRPVPSAQAADRRPARRGAARRHGRRHRHQFPVEALHAAAAPVRKFVARNEGLIFEDKGASVALHYRLAPQLADAARKVVEDAVTGAGGAIEMQVGKMVFELKPAGCDKGKAIEEFMRDPPSPGAYRCSSATM